MLVTILTIIILVITTLSFVIMFFNWLDRRKKEEYERGFRLGQNSTGKAEFLCKDEKVIPPTVQNIKKVESIRKAKSYIKMLITDGGNWLPLLFDEIKNAQTRGVNIQILFLDPISSVNDYLSRVEPELTKDPTYSSLIISAKERAERITKNSQTFKGIAKIKFYDSYAFWRGMIVDGKCAFFRITHIPFFGWEAPERETANITVVKHFERYYFDKIWEVSRELKVDKNVA